MFFFVSILFSSEDDEYTAWRTEGERTWDRMPWVKQ